MLKISNAKAKTWRRCPNAYHYKYIENIEPRKKKPALLKGSMIHEMIDAWRNGEDWEEVLQKYQEEYDKMFIEEKEEYGDIIADMGRVMQGYVNHWGGRDLKYIEVNGSATEHHIEVELIPNRVLFTGVIDRIGVDKKNRVWLTETKSFKKKLPKEDIRMSDLQTVLYYWAAPKCGFPTPDGVMWDYVKTKPPTIPEELKRGGLSKKKNIDTTYETYLAAIEYYELEVSDYADILEDLRSRPNDFYRRVYRPTPDKLIDVLLKDLKETALVIEAVGDKVRTRHLSFDCGWSCNYNSLCQAELQGLDTDYLRSKEYQERRDPDESKEVETEED